MKFLCPSCKAKYQIADEKVAGRSVRMKCRKCGHVIQVSSIAGVGDALHGSEPPAPSVPDLASAVSLPRLTPPPPAAVDPAPVVVESGPAPDSNSAPVELKPESKGPPVAPTRPSIARPAPPAKAPLAPKPPAARSLPARPSAAESAVPAAAVFLPRAEKKTMQGGASAPLPTVGPAPPKPASLGVARAGVAVASAEDFGDEDESTRIADASALMGAFSLAVAGVETPPIDALSMPADEWFVGINGVPVGPIRLSELRSKAASGSVNRDSLVWRDGFEDWRPLKTYPELVAIVDESVSSARASLTPFTPSVAIAEPIAGRSADVFAPPAGALSAPDAFAVSAATGGTGAAVVTDDLEAAGLTRRGGSSLAAWVAMVMALLFGLTIGFVLFKQKPTEIVKYLDRPVPSAASGVAESDKVTAIDESTVGVDPDTKSSPKHTGSAARPGVSAEPDKATSGLKGLPGLSGLGPNRGPESSGPSSTVASAGQLDGGQIQNTVARYTGSVKRACWQPALDTRDKDAPTTARVNVAITVLPSGSVQSAAVNGDPKGYRGLSQCISSRVRGWQFPPSGDTTTVNVPFVFAAQ